MNEIDNIRHLKRHEIDDAKWDATVGASPESRIYATTYWLDILHPGWEALVTEDCGAVMPLTGNKKFAIAYLSQPYFTQQLGFYSCMPIDENLIKRFINRARALFSFAEIFVNFPVDGITINYKNYVLPLNNTYSEIRKNYSKSLIQNSLKPLLKINLIYNKDLQIDVAIEQYKKLYQAKMKIAPSGYERLKLLANNLCKNGKCFTRQVYNDEGNLLAISLFFFDSRRIYNVVSSVTVAGRKLNANYFLYDELIKEFSEKKIILDYEGSNVPGIEMFYRKFGATPEPYYFLKWNDLKWPLKLFKK